MLLRLASLCLGALLICGHNAPAAGTGHAPDLTYTSLVPEHDTRPSDVREYDESNTRRLVAIMSRNEQVFNNKLVWQKKSIVDLLSSPAPFCELDFDALNTFYLTPNEKKVLKEYFIRGGFVIFSEDAYPYSTDQFWPIKSYPAIDFLTKELPAADPGFKVERVTDGHPLFRQYHKTTINSAAKNEIRDNPNSPDFKLVTYRGHPCAWIYGNYFCIDDSWVALPRPFEVFPTIAEDYALNVNLYVYAAMH